MKPSSFQLTLAFLLVTTSFAQHNPLKDPNICGRPTCKGSGKFKYGPGTQQNYKYSVDVRSMFNGTSKNESSLFIEANAKLDFLTPCDGLLTLYDLKLIENHHRKNRQESGQHPDSEVFGEIISEYTLRFSFNDGVISEICPQEDEKNWVLNFKRGLLSMLHNTMKRFDLDHSTHEEDVRGKCPTHYRVNGAKETSLIIEKIKDLNKCQSRSKLHSIVQSVPYDFRSKLQEGKDLLESSSRCEMSIDHKIYNKITCQESHILQPFSNQDTGATTIVRQELILESENNETLGEQEEISRRTSLLFDHVPSPKPTHGELKTSRDLIKKMCRRSTDDVQIEFSDLFTRFIQSLRVLSYPSLSALYGHSGTTCPTGKKHLLDALPYVGSSASVIVMKDIILKRGVPESTTKEWMMTLAFISRPDEKMMEAAAQLLLQKQFEPYIVFSVTALTHTYCSQHSECQQNEAVNAILEHLQTKIVDFYNEKPADRAVRKRFIVALKALGNIGVVLENFEESLFGIIKNKDVDISVRVAAVETFRRLSCEGFRNDFEQLFRDQNQDAELRIAAYLQIMRCPNYLVIRTIKHSLEVEEVNQVGSFVWSHLTNLAKSTIPSRVELQSLLADIDLVKKFSSDVRKFSHHREGSIFFQEYNIGANYDSNVIFSPSSYVPRSAMLNFTVDMFGESINLFEIYGRFEGFEQYLEAMFGPKGPLNVNNLRDKIPKMRWPRNTAAENEVLKSEIDKLPNVMESPYEEPRVSLGLKVFGNDLKYGDEEIKSLLPTLNPVDHLKRILSGKEINYNKAVMFLDSNYVVPSGAGLPISLSAVGTASINLKLFGSLNGPGFTKTEELDLKADIRPSVTLELTGSMFVDAFYASTGIKLRSSMYTSSAVEGNIKIRGTKLVSVKFSIPRQTSEIFGVKSELFVMENNNAIPQSGLSKNRVSKSICSWPAVDKTVGLKLCGEYHFMNVTKINTAPYFILAGPAGFRFFLEKSDPTAKIYLFEYKWTEKKDLNVVSLTFDTPGSSLRRLLSANFTVDKQSQNLTLLLQSSAGTIFARGKYKNTEHDKYLQMALDINDKKHFDFNLSLSRLENLHGFTLYPKVYLGVNGERVLELQGTLKLVSKKGVSQYDVDLKFQTKRLTSKLFGYISKAEASVAANLKLDYKFANTKEQRVIFEFSVANRSPRNLFDIRSTCSLFSTAYPKFNFDAKFKFQRGAGPIECKFDLNSSPLPPEHPNAELEKLKFEWSFSYKSLPDSTRTLNTIVSVNRQSSGLNLKGQLSYEARSPDVNIVALVKYANDKEVSVAAFWSHPRSTLEQMEGRINITVPSFTPMILQGKLKEKVARDYIVEISGTWFSGHSISARGFYQDKSTARSLNQHVKLLVKSPSFQDINTDLQFYRDNDELKIDLKVNHDKNDYLLYFKHKTISPEEITTEVKLKYKTRNYSMLSSIYMGDHRRISVEFHIDQLRDIHLAAWEYNKDTYKAAGLEVKWDANRDNNQKLVVAGNFTNLAFLNYKGNLLVSYPGRTILADFDLKFESRHFNTLVRLSWADQQSFAFSLSIDYEMENHALVSIKSQIVTPFDGWQKTSIIAGYHHLNNMYRLNGSVFWKHEHVTVDLYEDYAIQNSGFYCKLKCGLSSTFPNIPTLSATLTHNQTTQKVDSHVKLIYNPENVIDVKSNWKVDRNQHHTNLTGTILLNTPFKGFARGYLISKIHYTITKYVRGFADLDLDHKKFTINLEGNLQKLTNSMLVFNVTTPLEKYKQLEGRFGFSEERRHIVAEVLYPSGSLGFEILLSVESIINFDVKLSLGTPISFLQNILLVAKLKPDCADFRVGWNSFMLGFNGLWHYVNVIDFEYSYKIYTPIDGFKENGIVAKLIFKEGLDFEVSIKLSDYKLGLAVSGQPKPKIFKELDIKVQGIHGRINQNSWLDKDDEDYEFEEEEYADMDGWTGFIEIDAIIHPTMQGTLDIDQEGPLYIIQVKLSLPDGIAQIDDEFEFIDIKRMRNELHATTPYDSFKTIVSNSNLEIIPGNKYEFGLSFDYQNRSEWIKSGMLARYGMKVESNEEKTYNITLQVHTPLKSLPQLEVRAALETEKNIYRTNLSVTTNSNNISVLTKAEIDNGFLDTYLFVSAITPKFVIPPATVTLKKNFTSENNIIQFSAVSPKLLKREIYLETNWLFNSLNQFHTSIELNTPYKGLENNFVGVLIFIGDRAARGWFKVHLHPLQIESNSTMDGGLFTTKSNINFNGQEFPLSANGNIQSSINRKDFTGIVNFKNKVFRLSGNVYTMGKVPVGAQIKLAPEDGSNPVEFEYRMQSKEPAAAAAAAGYAFVGSIRHGVKFTNFQANLTAKQKFDWQLNLQIDTSHQLYNKFSVQANATSTVTGSSISIHARTPIPKLENSKLGASIVASGHQRSGRGYFDLAQSRGTIELDWVWLFLENMNVNVIGSYKNPEYSSQSRLIVFYNNPDQSFKYVKLGGNAEIDSFWTAGFNTTLTLPNYQDMALDAHFNLPAPIKEVYSLNGKLNYDKDLRTIKYLGKYRASNSGKKYGSSGNITLADKSHMSGGVEVEWNNNVINNFVDMKQSQNTMYIIYKLRTPKFYNKDTLVAEMSYKGHNAYHNITCEAFYPEKRSVAFAQVDFRELGNMNGTVNVTIPFRNISYTGAHFITKTNAYLYKRYLRLFWSNETALLDCKCTTKTGLSLLERNTTGVLVIEIPLTTRHVANIDFGYDQRPQLSIGRATVDYNGSKVLEGKYNCLSESRAGFDKDTIHVEVQNKLVPIGADYVHGYEYGASRDGSTVPTLNNKKLHLYHLQNRTKFNITGQMRVQTTTTGRKIAFEATHLNRTVKLWTDYDVPNQQFKQHTRLELGPRIWLEYDLDLLNKTTDESFDAQRVQMKVAYPRRNFTAIGSYNISDFSLSTDVSLTWDRNNKTVQAALDWRHAGLHREEIHLEIKHPSFERDVSFFGEYEYDNKKLLDAKLTVNYSNNPEQIVKVGSQINDNSDTSAYNYTYNLWAVHDATNLNLNTRGGFYWNNYGYNTGHYTDYKRSYLPLQTAEALARVDFIHNEMELKKKNGHLLSYLWARYGGAFPTYTANVSTAHEMNNASGEFYLNFQEKLLQLNFNMTTDGSQSFHMYGFIPDARSAVFDVWRDYEDIRVSDVAYYLRLNHSRLITSRLQWRPDLIHDVQSGIRSTIKQLYSDALEGINNTKQYIRAETNDAIHGIWYDAKPLVQHFLDDLRELKDIENDFEDFKKFLNDSYNTNDFYIRDISKMIMVMFDELALKSHLQSLPVIVAEIWEVMGESGKKIRESILWVVENIKIYYKNTSKFIHNLFEGDPIDHLSDAFKSIVEQYDNFIKEIHVAFIRYMEQLWKQIYALVIDNWHKMLQAIEPTFLKIVHYLETIVWNTSKEFLDFLYIRKNELIESPYFAKFTNFTHDLDRFYKDITGNNTISSAIKYTKIVWNFLKEKYFNMVPFGKELKDVVSEIIAELNELRSIPSLNYFEEKLYEVYLKLKWFYYYFDMEQRIQHFITLVHQKLTDISQTALEAENNNREAKTKFIFEPNDGIMLLEQKLPMSWHAFNETPKFQEIPELKTIYSIQNYFVSTRTNFWDFYYDYKVYTEISSWLPPFRAQAILVGSRFFMTFDKKYYEFTGDCSYLLATDYLNRSFTIVVSYDKDARTHELLVLINKTVVHINLFDDSVRIVDGATGSGLPYEIIANDTILYREHEIVTITKSTDFTLECNMKFDMCAFDISGWYFGRTAGLWGTINNEPSDDFLTSQKYKAKSNETQLFTDSWTLGQCKSSQQTPTAETNNSLIKNLCDEFFFNSVSQLGTCFSRVDKTPFSLMCLHSSTEEEACGSAIAYIKMCEYANTPLRIPDVCVKCESINGNVLNEGQFITLEGSNMPQSADIVFIVEAKECNKNLKSAKNLDVFIEMLEKELGEFNITSNRYTMVAFGGDGVFDQPRSITFGSNVFTDFRSIINYFDSITLGNGNSDFFGAITFASHLLFRPGVSKTFILIPCSDCKENNMKLDYAILHQLLLENDVTLHILMNEEFSLQKTRDNKIPFGIDRNLAYTKKDIRTLKGDAGVRKQVSLPKSTLGHCMPLALESNGSVFSGKNLEADKKGSVKKFATVFAKRIANSARPASCVNCECTAFNTGISYMECYPCAYPTRANIDYGFDEDGALSLLQPADDLFGATDYFQ